MNVNLADDTMQALVTKAVFDSLTSDKRDELVMQALKSLMLPQKAAGYSQTPQPSPLQEAFSNAARIVSERIVRDHLTNDPSFEANIKGLMSEITTKLFAGELRDKVVDAISTSIESGMRKSY